MIDLCQETAALAVRRPHESLLARPPPGRDDDIEQVGLVFEMDRRQGWGGRTFTSKFTLKIWPLSSRSLVT